MQTYRCAYPPLSAELRARNPNLETSKPRDREKILNVPHIQNPRPRTLLNSRYSQDLCGSSTRGGEDPERQLYKLWERFHLEMSNEEAYAHMQALISQSQSALVPQVVEWAHKLKQDYWTM